MFIHSYSGTLPYNHPVIMDKIITSSCCLVSSVGRASDYSVDGRGFDKSVVTIILCMSRIFAEKHIETDIYL